MHGPRLTKWRPERPEEHSPETDTVKGSALTFQSRRGNPAQSGRRTRPLQLPKGLADDQHGLELHLRPRLKNKKKVHLKKSKSSTGAAVDHFPRSPMCVPSAGTPALPATNPPNHLQIFVYFCHAHTETVRLCQTPGPQPGMVSATSSSLIIGLSKKKKAGRPTRATDDLRVLACSPCTVGVGSAASHVPPRSCPAPTAAPRCHTAGTFLTRSAALLMSTLHGTLTGGVVTPSQLEEQVSV